MCARIWKNKFPLQEYIYSQGAEAWNLQLNLNGVLELFSRKLSGKWRVSHLVCLTLWPHGLYSLSGSSVHGISQARILDWITISFSRGSSQPRDWTSLSCIKSTDSLLLSHKGSPYIYNNHVKNKPHLFWIN